MLQDVHAAFRVVLFDRMCGSVKSRSQSFFAGQISK